MTRLDSSPPRRRGFTLIVIALVWITSPGCGENPQSLAGTINLSKKATRSGPMTPAKAKALASGRAKMP